MLSKEIPAIYINLQKTGGTLTPVASEISLRDVFACGDRESDELSFFFESTYAPYQKYSFDTIDGIDLVVKDLEGNYLSPLEVKLTVLPDNTTYKKKESEWGAEMVIRSATTSYCALGMFDALTEQAIHIREIFEEACSHIQSWDNDFEMTHKIPSLCSCLDLFQMTYL